VNRKFPQIPAPVGCHPKCRTGAATVETAVCLPFLLLLIFAGVEFANVVFLKQTVNLAAFEAAKSISSPGDNNALALQSAASVMTSRRTPNYTILISPTVTQDTPRGTTITVTVTASASNLSFGPVSFMSGQNISAVVRMARL
jgi:Flp pilus assembly protein TadG